VITAGLGCSCDKIDNIKDLVKIRVTYGIFLCVSIAMVRQMLIH
jgi:hypothetical protein